VLEMAKGNEPSRSNRFAVVNHEFDGHTLAELIEYLRSERRPEDLGGDLKAADPVLSPEIGKECGTRILRKIRKDARAGQRIPFASPDPDIDLGITESAVRTLIRSAASTMPGVLVKRCRLSGDVTVPGERIRIDVDASALCDAPLPIVADQLRAEVKARLRTHTELNVSSIEIAVEDCREVLPWRAEDR
jgi:hypothetical protein